MRNESSNPAILSNQRPQDRRLCVIASRRFCPLHNQLHLMPKADPTYNQPDSDSALSQGPTCTG